MKIKAGQGISGWVAENDRPQIVNQVDEDPRHSNHISDEVGYHPKSVLCVPLRWEEGAGALQLLNKSGGRAPFIDDDLKMATVIAGHLSTAIAQAQSREQKARQERLTTLGRFLSSMLHDLKTPLTVISGYTQLLPADGHFRLHAAPRPRGRRRQAEGGGCFDPSPSSTPQDDDGRDAGLRQRRAAHPHPAGVPSHLF
jgi:GAF domain-containing protein